MSVAILPPHKHQSRRAMPLSALTKDNILDEVADLLADCLSNTGAHAKQIVIGPPQRKLLVEALYRPGAMPRPETGGMFSVAGSKREQLMGVELITVTFPALLVVPWAASRMISKFRQPGLSTATGLMLMDRWSP